MDVNGLPVEGFQSINLNAGIGAVPPLPAAMDVSEDSVSSSVGTSAITESEMEHIILEYKAAESDRKADKVLKDKVPDGEMGRMLDRLEDSMI